MLIRLHSGPRRALALSVLALATAAAACATSSEPNDPEASATTAPASLTAAAIDPVPFAPQNRPVTPLGYGAVEQTLVTGGAPATGQAWCKATFGQYFNCLSVSGGSSCAADVPFGQLVSCSEALTNTVDEAPFQPVSCDGNGTGAGGFSPYLTSMDWCLIGNLMPNRTIDTLYQYDDYVRLGVNRNFGGTIFELYGVDKLDRIMQNGGGATQLSMWGGPATGSNGWFILGDSDTSCNAKAFPSETACAAANTSPSCQPGFPLSGSNPADCCQFGADGFNVTNCSTVFGCTDNGWSAGGPINPIQAISPGCGYGDATDPVDQVTSAAHGLLTVSKTGPANFTKSDAVAGLTWGSTTSVGGPYAKLVYDMKYSGSLEMGESDQEIPAIFTHGAIGSSIYYYAGSKPYADAKGDVSSVQESPGAGWNFMLPGATMNATNPVPVTEGWLSACDATGTQCVTVATFSPVSQVIAYGFNAGAGLSQAFSYVGVHGHFAITPGSSQSDTVFLFPYRFDDVVDGLTVRQWIYDLQAGKAGPLGGLGETFNGHVDTLGGTTGTTVEGWVCRMESATPQNVDVYAGDPAEGGVLIASGVDSVANEPAVQSACNSTGTTLRFAIPIPSANLAPHAGALIYVTAAGSKTAVSGSGVLTVPLTYARGAFTLKPGGRAITMVDFRLQFQTDGNLVAYAASGPSIWASGWTPKYPYPSWPVGSSCVVGFQGSDGNLVAYAPTGPGGALEPYWSSGTPNEGETLVLSNRAAYLKILDANGAVDWTSTSTN